MKKILTTLVAVALAQSVYSINTSQLERTTHQSISLTELSTNNGLQDNAKATKRVNGTDGWSEKSKKPKCKDHCYKYECGDNKYIEVCGGTYDGPSLGLFCSYAGPC